MWVVGRWVGEREIKNKSHPTPHPKPSPLLTDAAKSVFGEYYREPVKSGPLPLHLLEPLIRSFKNDHFVDDTGDIVLYKQAPELAK